MLEADSGGGTVTVDTPGMASASSVLEDYSRRPATVADALTEAPLSAPAAGDGINAANTAMVTAMTTALGEVTAEFLQLATRVTSTAELYAKADQAAQQTMAPGSGRMKAFTQ